MLAINVFLIYNPIKDLNMNVSYTFLKKELIAQRARLFRKLLKCRDILPGTFAKTLSKCGTASCRCATEGRLHAVFRLTYSLKGKHYCRNIPSPFHRQVEKQNAANKEFKETLAQIHEINLKLLALEIKPR